MIQSSDYSIQNWYGLQKDVCFCKFCKINENKMHISGVFILIGGNQRFFLKIPEWKLYQKTVYYSIKS